MGYCVAHSRRLRTPATYLRSAVAPTPQEVNKQRPKCALMGAPVAPDCLQCLCNLFTQGFFTEHLNTARPQSYVFLYCRFFSGRFALFSPAEHHARSSIKTSFFTVLHAAQAQGAQIGTGREKRSHRHPFPTESDAAPNCAQATVKGSGT